jgi:hypothetical protein
VDERPQPELQGEQEPKAVTVIGAHLEVIVEQPCDVPAIHEVVERRRRRQVIAQGLLQATSKPGAQGDSEAHLAAPGDLRRQQIAKRVAQNPLRRQAATLHRVG